MGQDTNKKTLDAYEHGVNEYNAAASMQVSGGVKRWIDACLAHLPPGGHILEIGSAHGRDALYMESKGFKVDRTDAAKAFVIDLRKQGFVARELNALTDEFGGPYDMVFANAVLLHFTTQQIAEVLRSMYEATRPGGVVAFSVKAGEGAGWSNAKLKDPRYFTYWQEGPLKQTVTAAGLTIITFETSAPDHNEQQWHWVTAQRPN